SSGAAQEEKRRRIHPRTPPPCRSHLSTGSVPDKNTSSIGAGQSSFASNPDSGSTLAVITSGGRSNDPSPPGGWTDFMSALHIGSAARAPERPTRPLLSNPTQTPATRSGENPTNQASRKSSVVPVLPATAPRTPRERALAPVPRSITPSMSDVIRYASAGPIPAGDSGSFNF